MEHLIQEEQAANRRLTTNEKFNKAINVAKVVVEYTSQYSQPAFEDHIITFKNFTECIRRKWTRSWRRKCYGK